MLIAHRVDDIRAAEEVAFARLRRDGGEDLMQQAARGLAETLAERVPATEPIAVLVGPGNNGGDALFAAVHWCGAGRRVSLCLLDPEHVHDEGLAAALAAGAVLAESPRGHRVVVDALFGIGARPGLSARAAEWADWAEHADEAFVLAVDVPSGIDVDGGTLVAGAMRADVTVTFGAAKPGLLIGPAAELAGELALVDIGLEFESAPACEAIEPADGHLAAGLVPGPRDHKYSRGVVGVHAGTPRFPGAAHLCVAGALAGPIGMVRYLGDGDVAVRVIDRAPEVVPQDGRVQAFVVGPGDASSVALMEHLVSQEVPLVVDAGGLAHLPERFEIDTLLTPHAGELATMLEVTREDVDADPWGSARRAAERWDATVLLKGARTLVVTPDGRTRVNLSGTPWLGTAGAGDVLAGLAGSLLAAGLDAFDAASVAAYLHGRAAESLNPGGPITSSALAAELPRTFAEFVGGSTA